MAREVKEVRANPNKSSIDVEIKCQERWGWRFDGQNHVRPKSFGEERKTQSSTYVILSFSREQEMPYYNEIVKHEQQYNQGFNKAKPEVPVFKAKWPDKAFKLNIGWLLTLLVISFIICMFTIGLVKQYRTGIAVTVIIELVIIVSVLVCDIVKFNNRKRTYTSDQIYYKAIKEEMPKLISEYNINLTEYEKALSEYNELPYKAERLITKSKD